MRASVVKQRFQKRRSPDGAERNPGTLSVRMGRAIAKPMSLLLRKPRWVSLRSTHPTKEEIKEAERRQTQCNSPARKRRAGRATERRLAPPRPLSGALACRRSTTALPKGCVVPWCDPGQASWANRPRGGGHSADGLPTSSDAPRTPVVVPADMMPGPPECEADEAAPAGTALAPAARHHPDGVP